MSVPAKSPKIVDDPDMQYFEAHLIGKAAAGRLIRFWKVMLLAELELAQSTIPGMKSVWRRIYAEADDQCSAAIGELERRHNWPPRPRFGPPASSSGHSPRPR